MKFTISSSKLFAQLQAVCRVINNKNALPILDDVLFTLEGNQLTLTASDGEITVRSTVEVEGVEGSGKVASLAKLLQDTLKEFSEQPLVFTIDENNFAVSMVSQSGTYSFVGVNGNEYPEMPVAEPDAQQITMPAAVLQKAIEKTIFSTADDDLRPVMNGISFDVAENKVTLAATDAHRLVRYSNTNVQAGAAASFILPKKPAQLLKNLLVKEENDIVVTFGAKNARFEFGSVLLVCRLIEGRFPNYNSVIPQNNPNELRVDRLGLLAALRRVQPFANGSSNLIRFHVEGSTLQLDAEDYDFSKTATERMSCDYNGNPMSIGFKGSSFIEVLSNFDCPEVIIQLADPSRAGLVLPSEQPENQDILMLLMPMLIND